MNTTSTGEEHQYPIIFNTVYFGTVSDITPVNPYLEMGLTNSYNNSYWVYLASIHFKHDGDEIITIYSSTCRCIFIGI